MTNPQNNRAGLVGVGLDGKDGHKRITRSERFLLVGGSEETHDRMTETVVKTFESLDRKGKDLAGVSRNELDDLLRENRPG